MIRRVYVLRHRKQRHALLNENLPTKDVFPGLWGLVIHSGITRNISGFDDMLANMQLIKQGFYFWFFQIFALVIENLLFKAEHTNKVTLDFEKILKYSKILGEMLDLCSICHQLISLCWFRVPKNLKFGNWIHQYCGVLSCTKQKESHRSTSKMSLTFSSARYLLK